MHKILHVIDSLGYGGTELQLVLNVEGLREEGFESYVCHVHGPDHLQPALEKLGVQVFNLGLTGNHQWIRGVSRLRALSKQLDVDLIHTNLYQADVIGGITGRLIRRPVVSTIANVCFEPEFLIDNPRGNRVKLAIPKNIRSVIAKSGNTHLISVSHTVARSAIRQLRIPPEKTTVIHRALAQKWLDPLDETVVEALRTELDLQDSSPVLLNVGRLIPQKGQTYLIEAMMEVVREFPKAKLLIAGDGYLKSSLREQRDRQGLTDHITFLGRRNDIKYLHAVSDVFVFPSLFEGCPNALIEALVMGNACVASNIEPVEEVIESGENGWLVPPQDPRSIAAAVSYVCSDQKKAAVVGQKARDMALERFTTQRATSKLVELYRKVLHDHSGTTEQHSLVEAGGQ